ncbi:ABC transporter permease [Natrarchaeobius sp. A-rgal3]|uniref:ABC transporter permease n=1 Tax=Natrarchaeobius versutus TaxID=1679078 RepID=UPI00350ED5AD
MDPRPLTQRVRDDPRPAAVWLLGAAGLLAVEAGSIARAALEASAAAVEVGGSIASAVTEGGAGAAVVLGTVAIFVFALGTWLAPRLPRTPTTELEPPGSARAHRAIDATLVATGIGTIGAVAVLLGAADVVRAGGGLVRPLLEHVATMPTLTGRETIPNEGYRTPDGTWHGTFLGLSPAIAWALRACVVFVFAATWVVWAGVGYRWFRRCYRRAEWTPRDDVIRRLRYHRWGQFGMGVVFVFLTLSVFAHSLGPAPADQNLYEPFSHSIEYYDESTGGVETILVGDANLDSRSVGYEAENVGPMSYDEYDRFHPFGTLTDGKDLFTFLAHGARVSLAVGLLSVGLSAVLATVFSLISAYYRGLADLVLVVTGDTIMGIPRLLLLILCTVLLADTWLGGLYDGGVLLAVVLAATGWPYLWRAFRGPMLQIAEEEWVDAARSYGQSSHKTMQLHMLPYLVGYLLIYCSMVLGGVILAIAGLSFLGLGITAPTPEWGRAVDMGREYVATTSWHISFIPGVMVTLVVMGFNALGDSLRDAVDPKSDGGTTADAETSARGGGA